MAKRFFQEVQVTLLDKRAFRTHIPVLKDFFVTREQAIQDAIASIPRRGGLWYKNHFISWNSIFAVTRPGESKEPLDGQGQGHQPSRKDNRT